LTCSELCTCSDKCTNKDWIWNSHYNLQQIKIVFLSLRWKVKKLSLNGKTSYGKLADTLYQ
jgi:hypothetical protein